MPNKVRLFPPAFRILDAAGVLITTGAKIYVYEPTTTTPATTWSDAAGGTSLANPHVVPATGIADMWGTYGTAYRIVVKTPADVTLSDLDNVVGIPDSTNVAVLGNITVGTLTATTIAGTTGAFVVDNASNNAITNVVTITHTTSGSPAADIGTGIAFKSESADENPSDVGQVAFAFSDVGSGTEDSYFRIFTRVAGAAIKKAYQFAVTGVGDYIFTGAPTATRTITLPDSNVDLSNIAVGVYLHVGQSAAQTFTNTTVIKTVFNTVTLDNRSWWDAVNFRFTPQLSGIYLVTGIITVQLDTSADEMTGRIYKNGAGIALTRNNSGVGGGLSCTCSILVSLNGSTDYIEFFGSQSSGSSQNLTDGVAGNYMSITRVAAI